MKTKILLIGSLVLIILMTLHLSIGGIVVSFKEWKFLILNWGETSSFNQKLITEIRFPRMAMGLLVGASLALSGLLTQRLFKNPLAEPSLLGISTGASLFAALSLLFFSSLNLSGVISPSVFIVISAFIGAILASLIVYLMSKKRTETNTSILLLSGIAINLWLGAILGLLLFASNDEELRTITFWTMGSLSGADWNNVLILFIVFTFSFAFVLYKKRDLDVLLLGEQHAQSMGIEIEKLKRSLLVVICLLTATVVSLCGVIGFVALIVPHISRLIFGELINKSLYFILLFGGLFIVFSDLLAKTVLLPTDIPIGIITGIIGAPYFLYLILNTKKTI